MLKGKRRALVALMCLFVAVIAWRGGVGYAQGATAAHGVEDYSVTGTTSTHSWVAPQGVDHVIVELWGAGGGGGCRGRGSGGGGGTGGGAGGWIRTVVPVTAGTTYTITVGAGGAPCEFRKGAVIAPATSGGDTSFGFTEKDVLVVARGGNAGRNGQPCEFNATGECVSGGAPGELALGGSATSTAANAVMFPGKFSDGERAGRCWRTRSGDVRCVVGFQGQTAPGTPGSIGRGTLGAGGAGGGRELYLWDLTTDAVDPAQPGERGYAVLTW